MGLMTNNNPGLTARHGGGWMGELGMKTRSADQRISCNRFLITGAILAAAAATAVVSCRSPDGGTPAGATASHAVSSGNTGLPSATILLSEDFEDKQAQSWHYAQTEWQIILDAAAGSQVWTTAGSGTCFASAGAAGWGNYRLSLNVQRVTGNADVYFRRKPPDGYALRLESERLVLWTERGGAPQDLAAAPFSAGTSWHAYAIEAVGNRISVSADGKPALTYTDTGPACLSGIIGLEAFGVNGARFDNVLVTGLGSGTDGWVQTNGPPGGLINAVELDPAHPDTVFAGGMGGVYRSDNGGALWTRLSESLPPSTEVQALFINPGKPQVMYAFVQKKGKLYASTDGGSSWSSLFGNNEWITCADLNPLDPEELLVGKGDNTIWRSDNGGKKWSNITTNLPGYRIKCVAFGAKGEYWAGTGIGNGTGNGLLYRRAAGGASWKAIATGQAATSHIHSLFVDPQNRDTIYVGLSDIHNHKYDYQNDVYLVRLSNGGTVCVPLHLPFTDAMVNVIGRAAYDTTFYVGSGARLFGSPDGGAHWSEIPLRGINGDICDIAVDPRNTHTLYLPRRTNGVMKSKNGGKNWELINEGMVNTSLCLIAAADSHGSTLYVAGNNGEGTFKTTDYGDSWTNISDNGITHPFADELTVSPFNPRTVIEVADVGKFFKTDNGGGSWTLTVNPRREGSGFRAGTIQAASVAPSNSAVLYACKGGFGIFRSTNGGQTWDFLHQSEVDYTYALAVHPRNPRIVYSGYSPKPFQDWAFVRRSKNGGETWDTVLNVPHSKGITSLAIDPQNPNRVYAGSAGSGADGGGRIYLSVNGGDAWTPVNPHFTMCTIWGQPQLTGHPSDPMTAYAATWLGGTWKTTDAGRTWTLLEQAPLSSTALAVDPANPAVIYAADRTAARVWRSADGGKTWNRAADFSSSGAFLVNRVLVAGTKVYASTFGPGLHGGKLYVSSKTGSTWKDITNGLPRSVLDISIAPSQPEVIYVSTHIFGAYKSIDGGTTWNKLSGFPDIGAYDIEVDPVSPDIVYAAGMGACAVPGWVLPGGHTFKDDSGVYKSVNGGRDWTRVLRTTNECRAVRVHPDNHKLLFASALSDGFFVSTNGGGTWTNAAAGLDSLNLTSAWIAGHKVYAGTQGFGVYAGDLNTATGAVTWAAARSNKPVPDAYSIQIRVDPANSNRIFVGSNPGGLFRSDDGGKTWFDKNFLTPSVAVDDPVRQGYYTFAVNPAHPEEVWVGTWGKGVYKSYDGQDFNIGANGGNRVMMGKYVNALLFHPTLGVLAATEQGVFYTKDGGRTWTNWSRGLGVLQARTLSRSPDGSVVCGTAGYELYARKPSGARWKQLPALDNYGTFWPIWNDRPLYQYSTLLFHPTDPKVVYFGTFPAGIFKSLDGGATWREQNVGWLNDGVFTLAFHPQDTSIIYAGTYNGLNRSLDAGAHWERRDGGWPGEQWVFSIAFDRTNPRIMYACSKNGENEGTGKPNFHGTVMKSVNGGETWFAITNGLDQWNEFYKIITDKFVPDTLYLATQHDGVYISRNGGALWESWNDGLFNTSAGTNGNNVTNTMILSDDGTYLYFGSAGSGLFRRKIAASP